MADVITRFRLETTQYDSKLRDAAKGLKEIAHQAELGGKGFTGFNQKAIEAARSLGTIESGANNTKDKLKDLVGAFNDAAKAYNNLSKEQQQSDFGKAMAQSLDQLQQRIKQTKQELYGLGEAVSGKGGSGLFSGDKLSGMLQVFGGNVMTKVAGMGVGLANELGDAVKQGIELARQGEGIRIAFERLGRGDILQGLREATHGTVTDLELMKAAVKFNDFKLPLDELGTMLAFAQQKAKDTGQSVDYMVDSIVTGLGRKSLMILDNLGLSAAEIRERMKETGDMTKAVGAIIRDQMSKAGDYVETAADRATAADVRVKNAMEELGRTFQPISDMGTSMWTDLKVGALDLLNNVLTPLINKFTELGRIRQQYADQGGDRRVNSMLGRLGRVGTDQSRRNLYNNQLREFDTKIGGYQQYLADYKRWQSDKTAVGSYDRMQAFQRRTGLSGYGEVKEQLAVFQKMRTEYVQGAKAIIEKTPAPSVTDTTTTTGGGKNTPKPLNVAFNVGEVGPNTYRDVPSVYAMLSDQGLRAMMGIGAQQFDPNKVLKEAITNPLEKMIKGKEDGKDTTMSIYKDVGDIAGSVQGVFSALNQMGIEIPEELEAILSGIQSVLSFMSAMTSLISTITAIQSVKSVPVIGEFLAHGGIIKAAGGTLVGNSYSGDNLRGIGPGGQIYGLNAGEVVLNRAQVGNLASTLTGSSNQQPSGQPYVTGDIIYLGLQNYLKANGYGQLVTTKTR